MSLDNVNALNSNGITGEGGRRIDHIMLSALGEAPEVDSRNFVLCPNDVYDRSPCGTGTSAKLAGLAASDRLQLGDRWIQESIGSRFEGSFRWQNELSVIPRIRGRAYVHAEAKLIQHKNDPFGTVYSSSADGSWVPRTAQNGEIS